MNTIVLTTFAITVLLLLTDFAFQKQWLKWAWRIGALAMFVEVVIAIILTYKN